MRIYLHLHVAISCNHLSVELSARVYTYYKKYKHNRDEITQWYALMHQKTAVKVFTLVLSLIDRYPLYISVLQSTFRTAVERIKEPTRYGNRRFVILFLNMKKHQPATAALYSNVFSCAC